jgi:polysaccharide export outer membrane protein
MKALTILFLNIAMLASGQTRQPAVAEMSVGNLPIQQIGANDLVAISVYDAPELSRTVRVDPEGFIRLPMLKERIKAEGLLPAELEGTIVEALMAAELIVDPFVTVTVAEYNSRPISVMGAVRRPLTFQAAGPVTLLDALARAEGLSPEAGPVILLSKSPVSGAGEATTLVQRVSVRALIDAADPAVNIRLTGGEEIRVPAAGKIFVVGNVKKPVSFPVRDDSEDTVLKALAMAEGLMPYASKQAFIYRREASGSKHEIPIELSKIMQRKSPDVLLEAEDVLYIPDATGKRAGLAALEKTLLFGSGVTTALIYAGIR